MGRNRIGITVGNREVGSVSVDGSDVRPAGELLAPALVVPLTVTLNPRPHAGTLALTSISAFLSFPRSTKIPIVIGHADCAWRGGDDGLFLTLPSGVHERTCEPRFALTSALLRVLEEAAATSAPHDIEMRLTLGASVAWVGRTWNNVPPDSTAYPEPEVEGLGLISELRPVWHCRVGDLPLYVTRERWAEAILPTLGLDRVRLLAVRLPAEVGSRSPRIPRKLDAARRALDSGRFAESIRACRDVRRMVQRRVTGTESGKVAEAIARRRGLPVTSPQIVFLDAVWTALVALTNSAVHDDDPDSSTADFSAADARTCLLVTATLLEQLADALDPIA